MKSIVPILKTVFGDNLPLDWPRYFLKAVIWQVRKRLGHSFDTQLENGARVRVHPFTAYSGIFYARHPEGNDIAFLRKHSVLADTFVDVGAKETLNKNENRSRTSSRHPQPHKPGF